MVNKIYNCQILDHAQKVEYVQLIQLGIMNDIVYYISRDDIELGFLVERIWNSYVEIMQKVVYT